MINNNKTIQTIAVAISSVQHDWSLYSLLISRQPACHVHQHVRRDRPVTASSDVLTFELPGACSRTRITTHSHLPCPMPLRYGMIQSVQRVSTPGFVSRLLFGNVPPKLLAACMPHAFARAVCALVISETRLMSLDKHRRERGKIRQLH